MNVQSVQKYCFSLSNMQICGGFIAVVVVVAYASYNIIFTVEIWLISTEDGAIVVKQ